MVGEWLSHFQKTEILRGRPEGEGWLSIAEMGAAAGVDKKVIQRYIEKNAHLYESKQGTFKNKAGAENKTTFYRYLSQVRRPSAKRPRKGNS